MIGLFEKTVTSIKEFDSIPIEKTYKHMVFNSYEFKDGKISKIVRINDVLKLNQDLGERTKIKKEDLLQNYLDDLKLFRIL